MISSRFQHPAHPTAHHPIEKREAYKNTQICRYEKPLAAKEQDEGTYRHLFRLHHSWTGYLSSAGHSGFTAAGPRGTYTLLPPTDEALYKI